MRDVVSCFKPFFYPRSVAVVGASNTPGKWGFGIMHNILAGGYREEVYPVNRGGGKIQGRDSVKSVTDLPRAPDLALIIVPPPAVVNTLKELAARGARSVVIVTAGFGELGSQGTALEAEIDRIAKKASIPVVGPNCQGMMNTEVDLYAQILFIRPESGPLSIVSQSGNMGGSIMHIGNVNGVGFNKFVSSGNEAATRIEEVIEYFGEDKNTKAILAYIEGVRNGRAFFEVCKRVSLKKPIVAIKGGITEAGQQACASHTGALAGESEVFEAACRQAGVIMVNDIDELFLAAAAVIAQPPPRGNRVAILTMGGGWGVLAADACAREGLRVEPLSDKTMDKLNSILVDRWSHANPVDFAATPGRDAMRKTLKAVAEDENIDCIIQTNLGMAGKFKKLLSKKSLDEPNKEKVSMFNKAAVEFMLKEDLAVADTILEIYRDYGKPVFTCTDIITGDEIRGNPTLELMAGHGITVYPTPVKAARILGKIAWYSEWRRNTAP